jgi:hypothetical protein
MLVGAHRDERGACQTEREMERVEMAGKDQPDGEQDQEDHQSLHWRGIVSERAALLDARRSPCSRFW